jgi:hypothetical protein
MKVKHIQQEGREIQGEFTKRGRGRPKKNPDAPNPHPYGRPDTAIEQFMRSEDKAGGPSDPISGFEDCVN